MFKTTILILDRNPHQSEFFVHSFQEEGILAKPNHRLESLMKILDESDNQFVLLDYPSLTAEKRDTIVQLFKSLKSDRAVVYNVPKDAAKRIVFYELGALRVYDQTNSIEEVFRGVMWWFGQFSKHPPHKEADIKGDLFYVDLLTLIWGLAESGKSGILKITTSRNHGHVFFKNGEIVEAKVLNHSGLDAFLHICLWEEGKFVFTGGDVEKIEKNVNVTVPGLMILIQNLKLQLEPLKRQFRTNESVVQAINLGDLPLYDIQLDPEFVDFLAIPRELGEVLENPFYPNHQTLQLLIKLKRFGLLRVNEPIETLMQREGISVEGFYEDQSLFKRFEVDPQKTDELKQTLALEDGQRAKIVVISDDLKVLKHYLNTLVESPEKVFLENNMYIAQFSLGKELDIVLIGMRANHQLLRLLSVLSEQIHGFMFLINAQNTSDTGYFSYLINQVLSQHGCPAICAVTYLSGETDPEEIKKQFFLSWKINWAQYAPNSQEDMLNTIFRIAPVEAIEVKKSQQAEDEK